LKKIFGLTFLILGACGGTYYETHIEDAEVFHWYNKNVTRRTFLSDHKKCLGVENVLVNSQFNKFFSPATPKTIPRWDGIWATFASREDGEVSQPIAVGSVSGQSTASADVYADCMKALDYIEL
jgi:hypothetical protein